MALEQLRYASILQANVIFNLVRVCLHAAQHLLLWLSVDLMETRHARRIPGIPGRVVYVNRCVSVK